jgi:hypothetical protein
MKCMNNAGCPHYVETLDDHCQDAGLKHVFNGDITQCREFTSTETESIPASDLAELRERASLIVDADPDQLERIAELVGGVSFDDDVNEHEEELEKLRAEVAELKKDRALLDCFHENGWYISCYIAGGELWWQVNNLDDDHAVAEETMTTQ